MRKRRWRCSKRVAILARVTIRRDITMAFDLCNVGRLRTGEPAGRRDRRSHATFSLSLASIFAHPHLSASPFALHNGHGGTSFCGRRGTGCSVWCLFFSSAAALYTRAERGRSGSEKAGWKASHRALPLPHALGASSAAAAAAVLLLSQCTVRRLRCSALPS